MYYDAKSEVKRVQSEPAKKVEQGFLFLGRENIQPRFRSLLYLFKLHLKICNFLGCVLFQWDEKFQRVALIKSTFFRVKICKLGTVIQVVYAAGMGVYFVTPTSLKSNGMGKSLIGAILLSIVVGTLILCVTFWAKGNEAVNLWNTFLTFEEKFLPNPDKKLPYDKIAKFISWLGIFDCVGLGAFIVALLIIDPCQPPHLGHIFLKTGAHLCDTSSLFLKHAFLLIDTTMWIIVGTVCPFYVFQGVFLLLRCMDSYLQLLTQETKQQNIRGNKKGRQCFRMYNCLTILGKRFDSVFQEVAMPTIFSVGIFAVIIPLYTCIKLHSKIPMPGFAFFPLATFDGCCVLYIANVAGKVWVTSRRYVTLVQKSNSVKRTLMDKKTAKSLEVMKVHFGSGNFVEELTPLRFLDFSFNQTVSMMLIKS